MYEFGFFAALLFMCVFAFGSVLERHGRVEAEVLLALERLAPGSERGWEQVAALVRRRMPGAQDREVRHQLQKLAAHALVRCRETDGGAVLYRAEPPR